MNLIRVRSKNIQKARQKAWQFATVSRGKTVVKPVGGFGIFDFEVESHGR